MQGLHTPPARPSGQAFGMNVPRETSRVGELPDRAPISFRAEAREDRPSRADRPPMARDDALPPVRRGGPSITTRRRHGGGRDGESRQARGWRGVGSGECGSGSGGVGNYRTPYPGTQPVTGMCGVGPTWCTATVRVGRRSRVVPAWTGPFGSHGEIWRNMADHRYSARSWTEGRMSARGSRRSGRSDVPVVADPGPLRVAGRISVAPALVSGPADATEATGSPGASHPSSRVSLPLKSREHRRRPPDRGWEAGNAAHRRRPGTITRGSDAPSS